MKIISLQADNIKRLTAVSIKPDGRVVKITGKNANGKSSVLDSIWMALGGAEAIPDEPIHDGADEATIVLDLNDIKVMRKFKRKEGVPSFTTTLVVENADGSRPKSPQTLLNELVGRFSLDPLAFSRMTPKLQYDALKSLVPCLDIDAMEAANLADYEKRTVENRKAKEAKAAASAIQAPTEAVTKIDEEPILEDLARASDHNAAIQARVDRRKAAELEAAKAETDAEACVARVISLEEEIAKLRDNHKALQKQALELREKLAKAPALPEALDSSRLAEALTAAKSANAIADKQAQRAELLNTAKQHEATADALTASMDAREEEKKAAIAAAKFPVEGLSLGKDEVRVDGFPFSQAASSVKIKTSVALAMAFNPEIRVIRIMDGSLLDSDAMQVIADMAEERDYQVWCERVDDNSPSSIVIQDGTVKQ
jgi:hypothetical protein